MPAGLDGHPDPVVSRRREGVLTGVVDRLLAVGDGRVLVGIDGASGSGKSTMGDELARRIEHRGRAVVRSTIDSFHRPRAERMRRGPTSAEGYYLDSHALATVFDELLVPFREGAPRVRIAAFDEPADRAVDVIAEPVASDAVLVFDGLFLHRPELAAHWDLSLLLLADRRREAAWAAYLHDALPDGIEARQAEIDRRLTRARWPRYHDGWQLYLDRDDPSAKASFVIDNDDLAAPVVVFGK